MEERIIPAWFCMKSCRGPDREDGGEQVREDELWIEAFIRDDEKLQNRSESKFLPCSEIELPM